MITANCRKPVLIILCSALIFMALLIVRPSVTYACSCVMPAAPLESLEKSTAVFSGKVVSIKKRTGTVLSSADPVQVTFDIGVSWKGVEADTVTLTTALHSESCGFEFTEGESYLVYARTEKNNDKLHTGLCSRTVLLASAGADLNELGPGISTVTPTEPPRAEAYVLPQISSFPYVFIWGSLVVLAVLLVVFLYQNRNKRRRN